MNKEVKESLTRIFEIVKKSLEEEENAAPDLFVGAWNHCAAGHRDQFTGVDLSYQPDAGMVFDNYPAQYIYGRVTYYARSGMLAVYAKKFPPIIKLGGTAVRMTNVINNRYEGMLDLDRFITMLRTNRDNMVRSEEAKINLASEYLLK